MPRIYNKYSINITYYYLLQNNLVSSTLLSIGDIRINIIIESNQASKSVVLKPCCTLESPEELVKFHFEALCGNWDLGTRTNADILVTVIVVSNNCPLNLPQEFCVFSQHPSNSYLLACKQDKNLRPFIVHDINSCNHKLI